MNTFHGTNMEFNNVGIHAMCAEIMTFRKQLTKRINSDFKSQSGWDDALNAWMIRWLDRIGDTLENITYNPSAISKQEREKNAADTTRSLAEDSTAEDLIVDEVVLPAAVARPLAFKLDGSDVDIPQLTPENCPNSFARLFVDNLDQVFKCLTCLDSSYQVMTITKNESAMIRAMLSTCYTICNRKGGEKNRAEIPNGIQNVDEPKTFDFQGR